jgi:peroxiredoxin (alkyl hydroperoxide reductase subunit C)
MKRMMVIGVGVVLIIGLLLVPVSGQSDSFRDFIYDPGMRKPIDSRLKVGIGDAAPDFALPSISGDTISLRQFKGQKHVVLSFVSAAWTPVCTGQWSGYNIAPELFEENNAVLLGISVDNIPTLYAWTKQMGGLWFPILSDFWPHGDVARQYGVLRSDGTADRVSLVIDRTGIIRAINVSDINQRPDLGFFARELEKLNE